jgi:uncharacterized protein YjbI with pentapeptide repeats
MKTATRALFARAVCAAACLFMQGLFTHAVLAQDMLRHLDLSSPKYTSAELTRADIETAIASGQKLDFSNKSLNGLDLSGLNLTDANLRAARINKTNFVGAKLKGIILDQAWAVGADFSGADLRRASLFAAQMQEANFEGADLSQARIAGDFSRARLHKAKFLLADLSADMKNQSMGLMRAVFASANLEEADFTGANLARADLQFAKLRGADLTDANLMGAEAGGADFRAARLAHTNFADCDLRAAHVDASQLDAFAGALNLAQVRKD